MDTNATMDGASGSGPGNSSSSANGGTAAPVALCASCDRCRARKTKCDGARPCGNCAAKYLKKNKLTSIEGIDISLFECVYSPAKRRGPVPGRVGQARKASEMEQQSQIAMRSGVGNMGNLSQAGAMGGMLGMSGMGGPQGMRGGPGGGMNDAQAAAAAAMLGAGGGSAAEQAAAAEMLQQHIESQQQAAQLAALGMGGSGRGPGGDEGFGQQGGQSGGSGGQQGQLDDPMGLFASATPQQRQMMLQQAQAQQAQANVMALQGLAGTGQFEQGWGGAGSAGGVMFDQGGGAGTGSMGGMGGTQGSMPTGATGTMNPQQQQQLNLLQQLQAQQQQQQQQMAQFAANGGTSLEADQSTKAQQPPSQRARHSAEQSSVSSVSQNKGGVAATSGVRSTTGLPRTVVSHMPLLNKSNPDGNRLRSYYDLSVDELFSLPPIPSDEEYCARLSVPMNPSLLPRFDLAALQAARFAEVALGALANNQVALALELSNATVMCLRECVEEPVHPSCMYDVARAYLLHGIFRSFRGDMVRYFKYRRVCLTHLSQLDNVPGVEALLAAISFHDSWAYMIHNASEEDLPDIDDSIPPLPPPPSQGTQKDGSTEQKYGVSTNPSLVASNPMNQMWIQGPPPVFINNEAPALSRSLDALACAIRSCCDQANSRFEGMAREMNASNASRGGSGPDGKEGSSSPTPTTSAVMANQNELCSRNMVLSAFTLLQQHEASSSSINKNHGHHLVISAMDAFLEGGDEEEAGGFSDSQIQSLLSVCNTVVEHPLLLHQGGPTYHMVSNAAILLCHLLNGMHANRSGGMDSSGGKGGSGEMEAALFEEVLDTFITIRKILNIHRRKLPVRLRCHGIPRPNFGLSPAGMSGDDGELGCPFIDLGETLMCGCRGCQGFVLMACSPCVAAERAQAASLKQEVAAQKDANGQNEVNEFDKELYDLGVEFDLDDDALLNVLSRIIAT